MVAARGQKKRKLMRSFGVLYQSGALFGSLSLAENIALPLEEYTPLPQEMIQIIVEEKLKLVGLEGFGAYLPSEISGGMTKRAALARALVMNPEKSPELKDVSLPDDKFYIPSKPSLLSGFRTSVTESLTRIATIDFQKISDELVNALTSVSKLLNNPKVDRLITKMDNVSNELEITAINLSKALTEERIDELAKQLKPSLESVSELAKTAQQQVEDAKIPETAAAARQTAKRANQTLDDTAAAARSISEVKRDLARTLRKLDESLDSITELVNYIEEDPSSLLKGKQKPTPFEEK